MSSKTATIWAVAGIECHVHPCVVFRQARTSRSLKQSYVIDGALLQIPQLRIGHFPKCITAMYAQGDVCQLRLALQTEDVLH